MHQWTLLNAFFSNFVRLTMKMFENLHFEFFIPFPLNSFLISALWKVAVMVLILSGVSRLLDGKILQQHPVAIACCGIWWKGIFSACVLRIPWSLWMSKMVTVPRMCQVCSNETFYSNACAAPMLYCPFSWYPEKIHLFIGKITQCTALKLLY